MQLIFNSITLSNFGPFVGTHEFKLNRGPGLFFITGKNNVELSLTTNGVGKSSIINSIYWSLTGKTLRQQRPGSSIESWDSKGKVFVSLNIDIDDKTFVITRTRRPNSLTVNDSIVDQDYINKLIRLNEETLKRTIIVGQFVPLFLDLKPEQQSLLLSEALNLDLWLKAAESASGTARTLELQVNNLQMRKASLDGRVSQLKIQYEIEGQREKEYESTQRSRISQLMIELQKQTDELMIARDAFQAAYSAVSDLPASGTDDAAIRAQRALHGKCDTLVRSIAAELRIAQDAHTRLEKKLAKYQSSQNYCPECGQLVDNQHILTKTNELLFSISQSNEILMKLNEDYQVAQHKLAQVRADLESVEEEHEAAYTSRLKHERERLQAENQLNSLQIAVTNTEKELARLENADNPYTATCEKLAEDFCKFSDQVESLEQQIAEIIEESSIYKLWSSAYKEIRLNLIDETLTELALATNRHIENLGLNDWHIEFKTERENKSGTISHTFTTLIYPHKHANPVVFESYSGGESQRLQLAVTAGLSEILLARAGIDTNIEIFDEPSKALSREGISDLLECLKERAADLQRSIYFVDHNSIESGFFNDIITIEKNPQGSRIT